MSNDELAIEQVKEGDKEAYRILVDRYHVGLVRYCYGIVLDEDLANDIAQQAFINAYQHLHSYQPKYSFSTWLYRIARNEAYKELKKHAGRREFDEDNDISQINMTEEIDREQLAAEVRKALLNLRVEWRQILHFYYWEQKSYEEIAQIMHKTTQHNKSMDEQSKATTRTGARIMKESTEQTMSKNKPRITVRSNFTDTVMGNLGEMKGSQKRVRFGFIRIAAPVVFLLVLLVGFGVLARPFSSRDNGDVATTENNVSEKPVILPEEEQIVADPLPEVTTEQLAALTPAEAVESVDTQIDSLDKEIANLDELSFEDSVLSDDELLD